jgi:spermidine synthase
LEVIHQWWEMGLTTAATTVTLLLFFAMIAENAERLIYSKDSLYNRILVYEEGFVRTLRLGVGPSARKQSSIDLKDLNRHLLEYTQLAFAGLLLNNNPRKVLIIGLGGGVIPREMHGYFPEAEIDVVEIDSEVVEVAKKFFFFQPDERLRVYVSDGRVFVRRQAAKNPRPAYDMVILDAFNSGYIPFHMTTREFFQEVAAILHPKGAVVANVFRKNQLLDAQLQTFRAVYGRSYVFLGRHTTNAIVVCPGADVPDLKPDVALERANLLQRRHEFSFNLNTVARQFKPRFRPKRSAQVLTDDHTPILHHRLC